MTCTFVKERVTKLNIDTVLIGQKERIIVNIANLPVIKRDYLVSGSPFYYGRTQRVDIIGFASTVHTVRVVVFVCPLQTSHQARQTTTQSCALYILSPLHPLVIPEYNLKQSITPTHSQYRLIRKWVLPPPVVGSTVHYD